MRLPTFEVYRAFAELDSFSDEECCSFVASAKRAHPASQIAFGLLAVPLFIGSLVGMIFVVLWILQLANSFGAELSPRLQDFAMALGVVCVFGFPIVGILLIRDRLLRWAVRRHIGRASCDCGYSLLGLTIEDGMVLCPECGHPTVLSHRGLTPENLLVPMNDK